MQQHLTTYLTNERMLTNEVIKSAGLHLTNDESYIAIPVFDENGNIIFSKYRRAPWNSSGPKYKYDAGSHTSLYGIETIDPGDTLVFLTEGEFDTLVMRSQFNVKAVSSTGGSGSFNEDMANSLSGKTVVICYDYDEAGISGAFRTAQYLKDAGVEYRFIWIPEEKMDITDYIREYGPEMFAKLFTQEKKYTIDDLAELPVPSREFDTRKYMEMTKKSVEAEKRLYSLYPEKFLELEREMKRDKVKYTHIHFLKNMWRHRIDEYKKLLNRKRVKKVDVENEQEVTTDMIERAKLVPITNWIEFRMNKAKSIWRPTEKTPSMHYYSKNNRVYCFATKQGGDPIDVVMQMNPGMTFTEAVKTVLAYE